MKEKFFDDKTLVNMYLELMKDYTESAVYWHEYGSKIGMLPSWDMMEMSLDDLRISMNALHKFRESGDPADLRHMDTAPRERLYDLVEKYVKDV